MALTLITANRNYSSWSLRPWLLMKALGIAFEDRLVQFAKPDNYDDFRAFSPTGQVPVLIDGDRTVWDSLGITLYLAERHPGVWPADEAARAWAQCATAEMHGGFGAVRNDCTMNVGVRVAAEAGIGHAETAGHAARRTLGRGPVALRRPLARRPRFHGGRRLLRAGCVPGPHLWPGCRCRWRTLGRADPRSSSDARMGKRRAAETWREADHEAELAAAGTITADYRA